ncbi:MAG TPA: VWA domain-containing protein [Acidimicrobiales bacterium]|nr:VWA domain-containing protein [Acidimicrobiales bacterium]
MPEPTVTGVDRMAVAFSRLLRGAGLDVPVGTVTTFARALAAVGLDRRESVYWAGRATLVRRPEDVGAYDRTFAAFWLDRPPARPIPPNHEEVMLAVDTDETDADGEQEGPPLPTIAVRYSRTEVLRHKDFAAYTHEEFAEARKLMADLKLAGELRRSRRLHPVPRASGRPDLRRTVRRALRSGGEPMHRAWLAPAERPRRVVLLCDVSGSMEPYARALLRFLHAAVTARGAGRVEAFALGTRLTRITRELSWRDPDAALADAADAVEDFSGGTRLGEGLQAFNDRWGVRGMARGAVVVILSDGWDRGDPVKLGNEMARLRRVAHRVVWVNPLKAAPGYAPLARGMAAALPYVDDFVEGHSLASLEHLASVVSGRGSRGKRVSAS